ncbi:hypothetical protein GCM10009069_07000 [Algimonas arctica]|uniref:Uncharacterized protein n=1 Tax=Algimonas arctica TaxID=1479486 RepID=A0A8J3CQK2_9PROT|nr:hypothetical protein [Algimonas arctica]GHA86390.1 hypothetical protein GCM10009069_07000 [Algimonas arctica]
MTFKAISLLTLATALGLSAPAHAEDIFDILTRNAATGATVLPQYVPYRHTVDVIVSGSKGDDAHAPLEAKLRIDPSRPAGERVTILEQSEDARGEMEKALREMIDEIEDADRTPAAQAQSFWCNPGGAMPTPEDFSVIEQTDSFARLKPTPARMVSLFMQTGDRELDSKERSMAKKLSDRLEGEIVYDKPSGLIRSSAFNITRPMTVLLIAKIRQMEMVQGCSIAPNGHPYISRFSMDVGVTALGKKITNVMELTVGDLERIGPPD